ncbi:unnamed protein product [Sphagnum balticum]
MIKSSALRRMHGSAILNCLKVNGFVVLAEIHMKLTDDQIRQFYKDHINKPYFKGLRQSVNDGVVALALTHFQNSAVVPALRQLVGSTDSKTSPVGTVRNLFGGHNYDRHAAISDNALHASDSEESVEREMEIILPGLYDAIIRLIHQ